MGLDPRRAPRAGAVSARDPHPPHPTPLLAPGLGRAPGHHPAQRSHAALQHTGGYRARRDIPAVAAVRHPIVAAAQQLSGYNNKAPKKAHRHAMVQDGMNG